MAGYFGDDINSRADFQKQLELAKQLAEQVLRRLPHDPVLGSVAKQLEALFNWTSNGRVPTPDERKRIIMGIQMAREYEMTEDDDIYKLKRQAGVLDNYVKFWPDDATAADPKNPEYLRFSRL